MSMESAKRVIVYSAAVIAVMLTSGCGPSKTLTRENAKNLLDRSDGYQPRRVQVFPSTEEIQKGVQMGLWKQEYVPAFGRYTLNLTSNSSSCFSGYNAYYSYLASSVGLRKKVVEITGVTDAPASVGTPGMAKIVDVRWTYDFGVCPSSVQEVFKDHAENGQILFRLYDDGWRVNQ